MDGDKRWLTAASIGTAAWCSALVAVGQAPFVHVWLGSGFFFYDAFTVFAPLLTLQDSQLLAGIGVLNLDQELIPTQVAAPYAFSNALRQLTAGLGPAGPHAHSLIQAAHILFTQLAVAFLFRTLGVPYRYGLLGALVFVASGIHVSLTQHVYSSEALLYLALSLALLRIYVMRSAHSHRTEALFVWSAATLSLVSLVRGHHEAVLYLLPVAAWTLAHVARRWRTLDPGQRKILAAGLSGMAAAVAVCSTPMLIATDELTYFNKTLITDVSQLGSLFPEARSFVLALMMPHATGSLSGGAFLLGHDLTLTYVFAGSLSAPLLAVYVADSIERRRFGEAAAVVALLIVFAGFSFGGGPIYRFLTLIYPPFVQIGHSHYGLHFLYLLLGFGVASGTRLIAESGRAGLFGVFAMMSSLGALALCFTFIRGAAPPGLGGDVEAFRRAVTFDAGFLVGLTLLTALLLSACRSLAARNARAAGVRTVAPGIVLMLLGTAVGADHLRPLLGAHFRPLPSHVHWASSEHGGFNPGRPIVDYLRAQHGVQPAFRDVRVLPIFAKPGGWQANALWTINVALVSTPGDSGGNRFLEGALRDGPGNGRLEWLAEKYGVDYFWIARWGMEAWLKAAREAKSLQLVASDPWGGELYRFRPDRPAIHAVVLGEEAEIGWFAPPAMASRDVGWLGTERRFDTRLDYGALRPVPKKITLPLMWKAHFYATDANGHRLVTYRDPLGRLQVSVPPDGASSISVRYPAPLLQAAVALAAIAYLSLALLLAITMLAVLRRRMYGAHATVKWPSRYRPSR